MAHVGLHEANFTAVSLQTTVQRADFHVQLRLALVLERRQQGEHLLVFSDLWRVEYALTFTVRVGDFLLQVDRDELIMNKLHLAVTELKIRPADVFAPLVRLNNPDTVLTVRRARRARHVVHLLFVLGCHTHRIL